MPVIAEGALGVGLQLPVQSQSTIYVEPWEAGAGVDELTAVAQACDRAGFAYVAVCDHVAIPRERAEAMGTEWWDTIATLGYLAGVTERVRLLSHVHVLPYRHPLVTAKAFATLDVVSRGRVVLGVGAGHVEGEFAALGVPFAERGAVLDEAIDVVRAAFADEFPTHDGPRFPVAELGQRPRPVQPGGPPIWIGGSSPAALRRAAERGDGWLPQGRPEQGLRAAIDDMRARRAAAGIDRPFELGGFSAPLYLGAPSWDVGAHTVTGGADEVAGRLAPLRELGVSHVQVRFRSRSAGELVDQIEAFGAGVLPLLA